VRARLARQDFDFFGLELLAELSLALGLLLEVSAHGPPLAAQDFVSPAQLAPLESAAAAWLYDELR
jgi:hypothetical protein